MLSWSECLSQGCPEWSLSWVLGHRATAQALEWRVDWASVLSWLESYSFYKTGEASLFLGQLGTMVLHSYTRETQKARIS